ncbi:NUDIX hydrolase [Nocardioides sambongensis]|uniref:NUDIX hydrolase n=1 Tax=Nocardioides sambongensis TaxID=2589074 RepID=UPI001E5C06D8|nr:NUDIX hydrolase [Nocardioides sambongensis]
MVTFRPGREVLLVHRPKYDDWSFPKGKLDRGEHRTAAAVREVAEETGLHVRLGPPLADQEYPVNRRPKVVHYWTGRVVGDDDVSRYRPNDEIDAVRWVPVQEAATLLTYPHDRDTLAEALQVRRRTRAIIVLRHARARSRDRWRGADADRPLLKVGEAQAHRLVPLLAAYDASRVISSTSTRCVETVAPYCATTGYELDTRRRLSEENATEKTVSAIVEDVWDDGRGVVLCSHRPVLPLVHDALGIKPRQRGVTLAPAEMLVLHVRKQKIVAVERHAV